MELNAGQKISITLYHGKDDVEALTILTYLRVLKECNKPIPLMNTGLDIRVEDVVSESYHLVDKGYTEFKITLVGELIESKKD